MTKQDKEKIFESYKVVSEAGFGIPGMMQSPTAMTGSNPTGGFSGRLLQTPPIAPPSQQSTNPIPTGQVNQSANMANQIASLDAKINTITQSIDNLTAMVAKLAMPEKRVGPTTR